MSRSSKRAQPSRYPLPDLQAGCRRKCRNARRGIPSSDWTSRLDLDNRRLASEISSAGNCGSPQAQCQTLCDARESGSRSNGKLLVSAKNDIRACCRDNDPPIGASVQRNGAVRLLMDSRGSLHERGEEKLYYKGKITTKVPYSS